MKSLCSTIVVLALFTGAGSASAASLASSEKLEVKVDPKMFDEDAKALWNRFGPWCEIAEWHPAVRSCTEGKEGDTTYRALSLKDGGKIKEKLLSTGPLTYRYSIVESPLPVKNYEAHFSVAPHGDNKEQISIVWSATYEAADGKSDEEARAAIDGIFKDGIASIKAKLPKNTDAREASDKSAKGDKGGND